MGIDIFRIMGTVGTRHCGPDSGQLRALWALESGAGNGAGTNYG